MVLNVWSAVLLILEKFTLFKVRSRAKEQRLELLFPPQKLCAMFCSKDCLSNTVEKCRSVFKKKLKLMFVLFTKEMRQNQMNRTTSSKCQICFRSLCHSSIPASMLCSTKQVSHSKYIYFITYTFCDNFVFRIIP